MTEERQPDLGKLRDLIRRLRAPDGCPWDRKQTFATMRAYLLEEAHEVAAAIDEGDLDNLAEELGDLLFQVLFLAELGREKEAFDLAGVIDTIHTKMVDRHPHVFGDSTLADARAVEIAWEKRKLQNERMGRSVLEGIPSSLPALLASYRMTQKAAGVGFDWPTTEEVLAKIEEEVLEVREALGEKSSPRNQEALAEEVGDLLFTVANLARHLDLDPEATLGAANRKFRRRFQALENIFAGSGESLAEASLPQMDAVWDQVKEKERKQTR